MHTIFYVIGVVVVVLVILRLAGFAWPTLPSRHRLAT